MNVFFMAVISKTYLTFRLVLAIKIWRNPGGILVVKSLTSIVEGPIEETTKMSIKRVIGGGCVLALLLSAETFALASSDIADAVMNRNKDAVRSLLQKKADVNAAQVDGTTALH